VSGTSAARNGTNPGARPTKQHLVAGRIVRPHGVRGLVIVEPTSDAISQLEPGRVLHLGASQRTARLVGLTPHQGRYLMELEGFDSRASAESLRGETIEVPLADLSPLPHGVYYRWQIVGLRAVTEDGLDLGEIVEVFSTGANDVYEVERPDGRRLLLPAISSVVRTIDLEGGVVRIHLLPGLIDPA
jgi:16S rRNA processing protein RimM